LRFSFSASFGATGKDKEQRQDSNDEEQNTAAQDDQQGDPGDGILPLIRGLSR
jgi:hypothetical protein